MQRTQIGVVLLCMVLGRGFQTANALAKMTHAIIQMSGTDIPADSFMAQPKIYWRASNQYCRVDEQPDPENGIHGRLIVNEPDAWLVNLADNTAKHVIDPGPIEGGKELEFFRADEAKIIMN